MKIIQISKLNKLEEINHLTDSFYSGERVIIKHDESLPYHSLGGPGLERLCFLLLMEQGYVPQYFGKHGQRDYGVDLYVYKSGESTVYQCKNEESFENKSKIEKALKKFEEEWLVQNNLPIPDHYILCCPAILEDTTLSSDWLDLQNKYKERTGVTAIIWHKEYLDERLKKLPDIVADMFSNEVAEMFCSQPNWQYDLFHPVTHDSLEPSIKRYFGLKQNKQIYIDKKIRKDFKEKFNENSSVLIEGLPGTGKTITTFALTESFQLSGVNTRAFYIDLQHSIVENNLFDNIKKRLTRPTVFILDNCQGKYDFLLFNVKKRLDCYLANKPGRALFVFLARTIPIHKNTAKENYSEFEESFKQSKTVMVFKPNLDIFRNIINLTKPTFTGLSEERLNKIYEFTGHDLYLLENLLRIINNPSDIDSLNLKAFFENVLIHFFIKKTVSYPGFKNLAALAQFHIAPTDIFLKKIGVDIIKENEKAAQELCVRADRPLRYYFLHSSAAELIFRTLCWNDIPYEDNYIEVAAKYLIAFFKNFTDGDDYLIDDLSKAIFNSLKLCKTINEDNFLKTRFLTDKSVFEIVRKSFDKIPMNLFGKIIIIFNDKFHETPYYTLLKEKIDDGTVLKKIITPPFWQKNLFLVLLKRTETNLFKSFLKQVTNKELGWLIENSEIHNFIQIYAILSDSDDDFWINALDLIQTKEIHKMVERTIEFSSSIGTLNLALRELKNTDEKLLEKLEEKIGAELYIKLIINNGTIFELFRLIQYSSLVEELIEALDARTLDMLIDKTIASGRSIGTIHMTLWELGKTNEELLIKLEQKIGTERYFRLLTENGTIFELFRLIQYSSLVEELIEALDARTLDMLIDKTIASGRSIGTIHMTLWELGKTNEELLIKLEQKIGTERYFRLLTENGTIFELFMLIKHSSLVEELIEALDARTLDMLIDKTIASGRSIGTLDLSLMELKKTNEKLLEKLEEKIGAELYIKLIINNGTIFELFRLIQYSSLVEELIEALDARTLDMLIDKTIASGRSIGTLSFTLMELKKTNEKLLKKFEQKISIERWWKLIFANGDIRILSYIHQQMSKPYKKEMALSSKIFSLNQWQYLLLKGNFYDLSRFVRWPSRYFLEAFTIELLNNLKSTFETLFKTSTWEIRNKSVKLLLESPDTPIKKSLLNLIGNVIHEIALKPKDDSLYKDRIQLLLLQFKLNQINQEELVAHILDILPEKEELFSDHEFLRIIRPLFFHCAVKQCDPEQIRYIFELGNSIEIVNLINNATTLDLFLYLWNLYILWVHVERFEDNTFNLYVNKEIINAIIEQLSKRIRTKSDKKERDNILALAGLLSYLDFDYKSVQKDNWLMHLSSCEELTMALTRKKFIPATFFLIGIESIFNKKTRNSIWKSTYPKGEKYEFKTLALEELCEWVKERASN